jgi:hypothetical protein
MFGKTLCGRILSESVERNFFYCSKYTRQGCLLNNSKSVNCNTLATTRELGTRSFEDNINFNHKVSTVSFENPNDTQNIVSSPFPDVNVPNVPFSSFIWDDNAAYRGNNIALV